MNIVRSSCVLLVVLATLASHAEAKPKPKAGDAAKKPHHKGWPLPAAGPTMSGDPELLFTFDDGPNPKTTPLVLDALAKHHIHAIFFMVGEMAANKGAAEIIARILHDGHIIATHTMTHQDLCRVKSD